MYQIDGRKTIKTEDIKLESNQLHSNYEFDALPNELFMMESLSTQPKMCMYEILKGEKR